VFDTGTQVKSEANLK